MISLLFLPFSLIIGILLGTIYFRGLWLTLRKLPKVKSPLLLAISSFIARLLIVMTGFTMIIFYSNNYAILHLLVCLGAFFWVRNSMIKS